VKITKLQYQLYIYIFFHEQGQAKPSYDKHIKYYQYFIYFLLM